MPKNDLGDVLNDESTDALTMGVDEELEGPPDEEELEGLGEVLDEDLEDDTDGDDDGDDDFEEEAEGDPGKAAVAPADSRQAVDEDDDDEDDDELEADLDEILRARLATDDEIPDEEEEARPAGLATLSPSQEEEITCEGCFLFIRVSQLDDQSGEPACPHCGTPVKRK